MMFEFFDEIPKYYGKNSTGELEIVISAADGHFLTLNNMTGIEIGRKEKATLKLFIYCQNETTPRELAVKLSMDLEAVINATVENWNATLNIPTASISKVLIEDDKVGLS